MGLDLHIRMPVKTGFVGDSEGLGVGIEVVTFWSGNCTHNVSGMWEKLGIKHLLYESEDGAISSEILSQLTAAEDRMELEIEEFRKMNPTNGWGDADSALEFLRELANECRKRPLCKIWSSL